jgi:hypothetical protein
MFPPFAALNIGPFNVPLFPPRDKSVQAVEPLTYERVFAASKYNTNPSVTILGEKLNAIL